MPQDKNNKIGKIYKLHTDSERPNIQDNKEDTRVSYQDWNLKII